MAWSRNLSTTMLLCSALAASLVASGCKNRTDMDDSARAGDTSATFGGSTPDSVSYATGRDGDTTSFLGGTTPSRSLSESDPSETTVKPRRTRRSTSMRRMTPAERELYQQGQWDTTRLQQDTTKLVQPTPTSDTAKVDSTSYGNLYAPQRDTTKANLPDEAKANILGDTTAEEGEPTDAQIVQLAISVNSADSSAGELAQTRAANAQVRDYARMMVQDHGAANQRIRELVQRLNVTPDSTWGENRTLGEETRGAARELATRNGAEFDRLYIEQEIALHESVLGKLDEKLIPKADNTELKTLLQETRQTVQRHLERARELQNTLRQ